MASYTAIGLDDLIMDIKHFGETPNSVKTEMLEAMAKESIKYQSISARQWLDGEDATGLTANSLKATKAKVDNDGGKIEITFSGKRTDANHKKPTRNAEIAFINEFGKKGQNARPFIKTANNIYADEINQAGEKVYEKWLKQVLSK